MPDHAKDRTLIVHQLREELVGPSPQGQEIDCSAALSFDDAKLSYGPWRQKGSGEEILQRDPPSQRYGIGVLYPMQTVAVDQDRDPVPEADDRPVDNSITAALVERARTTLEKLEDRADRGGFAADVDTESDDFDLSTSNAYRPSSMGVSFLAEVPDDAVLVVEVTGGRYRSRSVLVEKKERQWWLREPVSIRAEFAAADLHSPRRTKVAPVQVQPQNVEGLDLRVEVFSRPHSDPRGNDRVRLLTVCLVNRQTGAGSTNEYGLFQTSFRVSVLAPDGQPQVLPYPEAPADRLDPEEESLALLYRDAETFAVGHGCAADWELRPDTGRAFAVRAECLPTCETPSITPDIKRADGTRIEVPMAQLAGLIPSDDGFEALTEVVALYETWIEERRLEVATLADRYQPAARRHLDECRRCVARMKNGLEYLRRDSRALRAFQLANHAILLQQMRTRREPRRVHYDAVTRHLAFSEPYADPDPRGVGGGRGRWRAFQVAFLLMTVQSSVEGNAPDRDTVELIWFPTGGGKTEAYLGLTAFTLFMRRLLDPADSGVHVLMRYTLRLLTAQQFQRACGLICAMESLRRANRAELGEEEYSIGIWLGGETTPNTRTQALQSLKELQSGTGYATQNKFLLSRCPWCGAQMGPLESKGKTDKYAPRVVGYFQQGNTVVLRCSDPQHCMFGDGLPIYVIDEDIYQQRPSIVIGTVDKFAMLAWRPDARAIFGLLPDGTRQSSPPGLIIQDELHLISGPLGSMVGLYETLVDELCTDRRGVSPVAAKIISSTATIRRYVDQIRALYAREVVALFPPPGLDAGDSFFARHARRPDGTREHGRMYVGVHAPGLGSVQTAQVRSFATLLQAPALLPSPEHQDPWWTLLLFYNSLRELGGAVSLFQSDIPDYLRVIRNRLGRDSSGMRHPWNYLELTGRLRSSEVPEAISSLEVSCTDAASQRPIDVCLASNIIEVGIDIDRLSLMGVVGQPKTTSQYIQVTGRVGRRWWERPGLVVTIYSASKPRDRSHFERFRSYHERLYAQVEPTSVTPFSPPAVDRALHAVMAAYARQAGDHQVAENPYPYPAALIEQLRQVLHHRVHTVDAAEVDNFERVFARRDDQWKRWERTRWDSWGSGKDKDAPLLRQAGAHVDPDWLPISWATPMSMRDVDAECEAQITQLYMREDGDHA